jgi:hypothetical protein
LLRDSFAIVVTQPRSYRSLGDFFVASAAGVNNDHRNKTEVRVVARSRFDLDLHCYADNDECVDPAIPQREI